MKVILIGDYPKDSNVHTGVQGVLVNLTAEFLKRKEIDLVIVSLSSKSQLSKYEATCKTYKIDLRSRLLNAKNDFDRIVSAEKPDIIHLQGVVPGVFIYSRNYRQKFVVTQHAILSKERLWQVSILRKFKFLLKEVVEKIYLSKFQNIIFISEYNKKVYFKNNKDAVNINYALIPNPVNELFFSPTVDSTSHNINEMYFVGEIKKRKGLLILLKAIAILKKDNITCKLHVIGGFKEKEYKKEILNTLEEFNLTANVVFCGWKNQKEIMEYTKDIPIFVLPSFQETLPLSIAEAMCQQKLVIATNVGGTSEMIKDKYSGYLFPAGDYKSLSSILKKAILNPDDTAQKSEMAKQKSKIYAASAIGNETIAFYNKIISKNESKHSATNNTGVT